MRVIVFLLMTTSAAYAQVRDCGPNGSPDVVKATEWTIDLHEGEGGGMSADAGFDLTITLRNETDRAFETLDAHYYVRDGNGSLVTSFPVQPESMPEAGEQFSTVNTYRDMNPGGITDPEQQIASILVCTQAITFADGTREIYKFE